MMPTPPIIVAENLDVLLYRDLDDAASSLEGPDVLDGIYIGFDSVGRPLDFRADGGPTDYSARVQVSVREGMPPDPAALADLLRHYLAAAGEVLTPTLSLDELLRRAMARQGYLP